MFSALNMKNFIITGHEQRGSRGQRLISIKPVVTEQNHREIVRRTLDGNIPEALMDYFVIKDHGRETRNRGCLINLPPIKLEYARRGFYFMGAKLYNELPLNIRTAPSSEDFYKLLNLHFS